MASQPEKPFRQLLYSSFTKRRDVNVQNFSWPAISLHCMAWELGVSFTIIYALPDLFSSHVYTPIETDWDRSHMKENNRKLYLITNVVLFLNDNKKNK